MPRHESVPVLEPEIQLRPRRSRKRVLLVDDDRDQTDALSLRLSRLEFDVTAVHRGQDALEDVKVNEYDLIVLDLGLPDMDGLSVCATLNDDPSTVQIPVIVVSGSDDREVVRRARGAGCRYFLHKPFDPNVLLLLAETALGEAN